MDWGASTREILSSPLQRLKSGIRVLAQASSGESFLTGLQIAAFSPRPPKKEKVRKEGGNRGKEQALWHFFLRAHQSQHAGPSLTTSSRYSYLLKAPSPNTIMLGIRASTSEFFWEDLGVTKKKSADSNR